MAVHTHPQVSVGFYAAHEAIGKPDHIWHDLRRTAATLGAQSGATLREIQHRLGHTTPANTLGLGPACDQIDIHMAPVTDPYHVDMLGLLARRMSARVRWAHPQRCRQEDGLPSG